MTSEELIFQTYRGKRLLLDANLLLLFSIGSFERKRVEQFKRTQQFTTSDFDLLATLLLQFKEIVTTPHLLTEVNSLANSLPENIKAEWSIHFKELIDQLSETLEPAKNIAQESAFGLFGLADASLQNAAVDTLILTEDGRLSDFLGRQGFPILNFRDLALYAKADVA